MNDNRNAHLEAAANETRAKYCGWAVIAGLVVEVALAGIYREHGSVVENWAPVFADALIALGVYGEILFSGRASRAEDELRRQSEERVAEANVRANEAQLALEQLKREVGLRLLDTDSFFKAMDASPRSRARLFISDDANDGIFAAMQIQGALREIGWEVADEIPVLPPRAAGGPHGTGIGISIPSTEWFPLVRTLSIALNGAIPGQVGAGVNKKVPEGELWITVYER